MTFPDATTLCIRLAVRTQILRDSAIRRGEMATYIPAGRLFAVVAMPVVDVHVTLAPVS